MSLSRSKNEQSTKTDSRKLVFSGKRLQGTVYGGARPRRPAQPVASATMIKLVNRSQRGMVASDGCE